MNKGFTLVELLAVLTILGIMILVAVPNVITTNKKSRENDIKQFKKTVENAAEVYVETHLDLDWVQDLKENDGFSHCINIKDLIADNTKGYNLLNPNLKNPENNTAISSLNVSVLAIKNNDREIVYEYKETSNCT